MATLRPYIILNPTAAGGTTGKRQWDLLRRLEDSFPDGLTLEVTTKPSEAIMMARSALKGGSQLVIAVGGDGTISEVVNGFFEKGVVINPGAELGLLCTGTARDVARNLRLPAALSDQIRVLPRGESTRIDIGRVSYMDQAGNPCDRYFINDCQPGIAAKVAERVTPFLKRMGGSLAFGLVSMVTAATYSAHELTIRIDNRPALTGRYLGVAVMNGRFAGGGMDLAPRSSIHDGLLDILVIHDRPVFSRLMNFPKIYWGNHINLDWITYTQGKRIEVQSLEDMGLEADGEVLGSLPCVIEVVPRSLRVKSPVEPQKVVPA